MDQVLKALPFIRNKLGGHEQSAAVVDIPPACGDLTIQIAADFQNFLITKHLERSPALVTPPPARNAPSSVDDEIPFLSPPQPADSRSQIFDERMTRCTPNDANLRQTTLENGLGTAFGTARSIELSLSYETASLFRSVRPIHRGEV